MNIYWVNSVIRHDVCWTPLTEFADNVLLIDIKNVICMPHERKLTSYSIIRATPKDIKYFLRSYQESKKDIRKINYVEKVDKLNVYFVKATAEYDMSISGLIYETGVPFWEEKVRNGLEYWKMIIFGMRNLETLKEKISNVATIKSFKYKDITAQDLIYASNGANLALTPTQLKILQVAYSQGYYEWPRGISLDSLSDKLGISKVAALKLIRKAEKKIIKWIIEKNL